MKLSRISFDLVVEQDGHPYYWEFHEQQYRSLTVDRTEPVYGPNSQEFRIPRFLQRLVRDVWRVQTFPDLTIVWYDWFKNNSQCYSPVVAPGFREYYLYGQFSFTAFCTLYRKPSNV